MKLDNVIRLGGSLALTGLLTVSLNSVARENVATSSTLGKKGQLKTTATGCTPATGEIDMDINNVRARLMTGGDMWWNRGQQQAAYEVPKGSGKSSQFAASCWIGGYDKQGQLKVAAQTYRQDGNDYWPGALDNEAKITSTECANWDRFWKVDRATINTFIQLSKTGGNTSGSNFDVINQWPGTGNAKAVGVNAPLSLDYKKTYAPFKDLNGNGVYEPSQGEYPDIVGDQYIWWVFNDAGNVKQQSQTSAMGIEVQTSAFAYASQDFLNNATFCNYRVINRGPLTIDSTYIAVWDDADLGYAYDDFIGCDTSRGLGILYNGTNDDGGGAGHPVNSYGLNPPQIALDFFQGPMKLVHRAGLSDTLMQLNMTNFTYYNNDNSIIGNPSNGTQIYYYMTGSIRNGDRFAYDFTGPGVVSRGYGAGPVSNFVFWGDPGNKTEWSECACNNLPNDRRFIFSSGPFQLQSGALNDITFGCVWASGVGGCPQASFKTIKNIDDGAQALFDSHFKTVEGPEAPRMVVRELDRRLVFYFVNDYGSNNYGENYGNTTGAYNDSLQYHQIVVKSKGVSDDSLYKFQGYRVFQLAHKDVTPADIFNSATGEVDNTKAVEVFQCDVRDGIKTIVNYSKNIAISDTTNTPQIKILNSKDSGIVHSFVLTTDQFAKGSDKQFVNYKNYYFVAIAYAYNNFAHFDPINSVVTQDVAYIGSAHGAGGVPIPVVDAIPNPANGDMGTVLNADYGDGVVITRLQGQGNGGNVVQLDSASEEEAVVTGRVAKATYLQSQGPIGIKVIDPVKLPNSQDVSDWVLQIGSGSTASSVDSSAQWKLTALRNGVAVDVIYSEGGIGKINEQIVEKYGLSLTVRQVEAPGVNQEAGNGYLTSDVTFEDKAKPWLYGVNDQPDSNLANWLRAGKSMVYNKSLDPITNPCNMQDYTMLDTSSVYGNMMSNFAPTTATWGPYVLAAAFAVPQHAATGTGSQCAMAIAYSKATQNLANFKLLPDVNLVLTSDRKYWTRCAVVEMQEDPAFSEGGAQKFHIRRHAGWNGEAKVNTPEYSTVADDEGMSWFPGYAVDQGTGERLNIVFGEDSRQASTNFPRNWFVNFGRDMIWNPNADVFNGFDGFPIFGGKHTIYVLGSKYDSSKAFTALVRQTTTTNKIQYIQEAYSAVRWVGFPLWSPIVAAKTLEQGLIPVKTTLRFRVNRPYASFAAQDTTTAFAPQGISLTPGAAANPMYSFSTKDLAPMAKSDTTDRDRLLSRIQAVPNPYYGYSGYENNRLDTRIRIINLPAKASINIYSLDGALVRSLSKNDPNVSYLEWDIRNGVGLPIASGMYLIHVRAEGIGETIIRWFGATRPVDISTY